MAEQRKRGARGGKNRVRRRDRKNIPRGRAYIQSTFNNTLITLTDPQGNVLSWGSTKFNSTGQPVASFGVPTGSYQARQGQVGMQLTF